MTTTWQQRHYAIRTTGGHPIAILLDGVALTVEAWDKDWPDSNTTAGLGQVLDGIIRLLNEDLGGMDGGSLWDEVARLAEVIHWDLDTSEIAWGDGG
jgi:hypothetical protein